MLLAKVYPVITVSRAFVAQASTLGNSSYIMEIQTTHSNTVELKRNGLEHHYAQ